VIKLVISRWKKQSTAEFHCVARIAITHRIIRTGYGS
jgi:hypothetical protein